VNFILHPVNGDVYLWGKADERYDVPGLAGGALVRPKGSLSFISRFSSNLTQLVQSTHVSSIAYGHAANNDCTEFNNMAVSPVTGDLYAIGNDYYNFCDVSSPLHRDAIVIRVSPDLKTTLTNKEFGSTVFNYGYGIAIHPTTGDVYVSGETDFNDFPATTGGFQPNNSSIPSIGMKPDGFVAKFSPDLATIKQATYFGGTQHDWVSSLAFDKSGNNLFLGGGTCSSEFPGLVGGAFTNTSTLPHLCYEYIAKISSDLKNLIQSTMAHSQILTTRDKTQNDIRMFVHPITDELYAIGEDIESAPLGYPAAYTIAPLNNLREHPSKASAMSPITGDIYIAGNQQSTTEVFPQTAGGYQPTSSTSIGGQLDVFIARYTSDDIGSGGIPTVPNIPTVPGNPTVPSTPGVPVPGVPGPVSNPAETPATFRFAQKRKVKRNAFVVSNIVKIKGIAANSAPISIQNGQYAIGCKKRAFTHLNGVIKNNSTVCVRHRAAKVKKSMVITSLTIGGRSSSFSSTTK
jgi:hypothetical protein